MTITKTVAGSVPQAPEGGFAFQVTCGDGESTTFEHGFRLDDGASTTLWLPYDAGCSIAETETGGADTVSFALNGDPAYTGEAGEQDPTLQFTTPDIVENKVDPTTIDVTNSGFSSDLELTKAADPASVALGSPVSFDLTVTNHGPDSASGVELTDTLPTGVTWTIANAPEDVSESASPCSLETGEGSSAQTLRCDIGTLDSDGTFSVTVTSSATTTCGTITNQDAAVTADTPDPNRENNLASASVGVTCPPPPPHRRPLHHAAGDRAVVDHDHLHDDHDHDGAAASRRAAASLRPCRLLLRRRPRSWPPSWCARSSRPSSRRRPSRPAAGLDRAEAHAEGDAAPPDVVLQAPSTRPRLRAACSA